MAAEAKEFVVLRGGLTLATVSIQADELLACEPNFRLDYPHRKTLSNARFSSLQTGFASL
jgi:hypothetical protein